MIYETLGSSDNPKKLVLKSRRKHFLDFDTHMDFDFEEKTIIQQIEYLVSTFESTLKNQFRTPFLKKKRENPIRKMVFKQMFTACPKKNLSS